MKSSARLCPDLARERRVCERGAEESVMLGVRWCLIVQRPGLSNCDWAHPPPSERQGKSEKLKSHNQVFYAISSHTGCLGLCAMRPSATSGPADVTQVISPQLHSAHAHSQDGNRALHSLADAVCANVASLCSWLAGLMVFSLPIRLFIFFLFSLNSSHFFHTSVYFCPSSSIRCCNCIKHQWETILSLQ